VIDGDRVITGSYNWTKNASEGNDENLVIISSASLAAQYDEEFWEIFNNGE
jgi:phosphatidylserine/phosphatidylglycerophosphate/cardiolipin synthase-like enzyme